MLFLKAESKWGVSKTSTVLALALLLLLSLQILTWFGRPSFVLMPCNSPPQESPKLVLKMPQEPQVIESLTAAVASTPNSYFPDSDSDVWHCKQHHVEVESYTDWVTGNFTDDQLLCAAHRRSKQPIAAGKQRIAFLFLTRGPLPLEPVWRKFFAGYEDQYSIYVHASDPGYEYPRDSIFYNRTIPSKPIPDKFEITLPEALRRLIAFALLDGTVPNAWFHLACHASVPVRAFPAVYSHVMGSRQSFVEAFYPTSEFWRASWNTTGDMAIPDRLMRKGEFWVTLHRRHAGVVTGDHYVFPRFKHHWFRWGIPAEVYMPTLMTVVDPMGISNHSLVYVNWLNHTEGTSSPVEYNQTLLTPNSIRMIQKLTSNAYGFYNFDKVWNDNTEESCVYNGVPNSPCYLFARKILGDKGMVDHVLSLSPALGYG
jgi:hypothetical protein